MTFLNIRSLTLTLPTFLGNAVAAQIRVELKASVEEIKAMYGCVPGLAVVLVGTIITFAHFTTFTS